MYSAFIQEESQGLHFSGETGCEILSLSFPNIEINSINPEQIALEEREQTKPRIWRWDFKPVQELSWTARFEISNHNN